MLFSSDPGIPGVRSMGPDVFDVTLADEDTNAILADNANRAIQGNLVIQVVPLRDEIILTKMEL